MLTAAQIKTMGLFDPPTIAALSETLGVVESVSAAGAINLAAYHTKIAVSGTMAFTLANGTAVGQRKKITCESAASTPAATLTIATPDATTGYVCPATFYFDTAGQGVELVWIGAAWRVTGIQRAGASGVLVVGTTVIQAGNLWAFLNFSITATVDSQTTKGIANGSVIGEMISFGTSVAATTPVGTIACTCRDLTGAVAGSGAGKGLKLNSATLLENGGSMRWDGAVWQLIAGGAGVAAQP